MADFSAHITHMALQGAKPYPRISTQRQKALSWQVAHKSRVLGRFSPIETLSSQWSRDLPRSLARICRILRVGTCATSPAHYTLQSISLDHTNDQRLLSTKVIYWNSYSCIFFYFFLIFCKKPYSPLLIFGKLLLIRII